MDHQQLEELWPAQKPPEDFTQRTTQMVLENTTKKSGSVKFFVWALAAAALVASVALGITSLGNNLGKNASYLAKEERKEIRLGERAVVVLEPNSEIRIKDGKVEQRRGNVFYRVAQGGTFEIDTSSGKVKVLGTCFRIQQGKESETMKRRDIKVGTLAAAIASAAVVTVYEGKVRLSHAKGEVTLDAGESGKLSSAGVRKLDAKEAEKEARSLEQAGEKKGTSFAKANDQLAADIATLNRKLGSLENEKGKLQKDLLEAQTELAKRTDQTPPRDRDDFDLDQSDWQNLAKSGTIKYRMPCQRKEGFTPSAEGLNKLGLAPQDAEPIREAYAKSYQRLWPKIRAVCGEALGNPELADALGPDSCVHVTMNIARKKDSKGAREAAYALTDQRAGIAEPSKKIQGHMVYRLFDALTSEMPAFEQDLTASLGPENAKLVAYEMCGGNSTFGSQRPSRK